MPHSGSISKSSSISKFVKSLKEKQQPRRFSDRIRSMKKEIGDSSNQRADDDAVLENLLKILGALVDTVKELIAATTPKPPPPVVGAKERMMN